MLTRAAVPDTRAASIMVTRAVMTEGGEVGGVSAEAEELRCVTGSEQSEESPVRAHHWPLQPPE